MEAGVEGGNKGSSHPRIGYFVVYVVHASPYRKRNFTRSYFLPPFHFPPKVHEGMKNVRMGGMYRARMRARALVLVRALSLSRSSLP